MSGERVHLNVGERREKEEGECKNGEKRPPGEKTFSSLVSIDFVLAIDRE